jgi:Ca2+-transporting ATPase
VGIQVKVDNRRQQHHYRAIAEKSGNQKLQCYGRQEIMQLDDAEMLKAIHSTTLLTRMFPGQIGGCECPKSDRQVVAMVGDGVK